MPPNSSFSTFQVLVFVWVFFFLLVQNSFIKFSGYEHHPAFITTHLTPLGTETFQAPCMCHCEENQVQRPISRDFHIPDPLLIPTKMPGTHLCVSLPWSSNRPGKLQGCTSAKSLFRLIWRMSGQNRSDLVKVQGCVKVWESWVSQEVTCRMEKEMFVTKQPSR